MEPPELKSRSGLSIGGRQAPAAKSDTSPIIAIASKSFVIWIGILLLAIANGALREAILIPKLGAHAGLILSGVLLSALIVGVAYLSLPWLGAYRPSHLWSVGIGWLLLTLVFEFSFGLWQGKSWPTLLESYTFEGGNIWPVVLFVTVLAPTLVAKLRGRV